MLHLPAIIERLTESNTAGACYLQLVPVEHILTMPDEVRGTIATDIVLREGRNWITVYPTRWTQEFTDDWLVADGARYSKASLGAVLPKDRASLLYGLWQLHHGRFVVLHYDMNRTVKVLGTVAEPAQVRIQRIQHGDKPGQDRNQYLLQVAVTRRTQCPFYLATPPEIVDPTECPNMTQLMVDSNAAFIAAALEDAGMLAGVQAIICTSCPSLCDLLDTALAGGGPDPEQPITVTLDGTPYTLTYQGLDGGKPWYQDTVTSPNISTYWDGSQWVTDFGDSNIFTSASDTPTPGAATGWTGGTGTLNVEDWSGSGASTVTDCLSPEQVVILLEALIALESWATIESLLSPAQLGAAIASLGGGGGGSLCDAIEAALTGSGPAGITLTSGANEDFLPQTGTFSGKPVYFLVDYAATGFSAEATWTGTEWYLTDGVNEWTSAEDVATPGDVVTWTGDTPLPTVVTSGPVSPAVLLDCLTTEQNDALFGVMVDARTWAEIETELDGTQLTAAQASICSAGNVTIQLRNSAAGAIGAPDVYAPGTVTDKTAPNGAVTLESVPVSSVLSGGVDALVKTDLVDAVKVSGATEPQKNAVYKDNGVVNGRTSYAALPNHTIEWNGTQYDLVDIFTGIDWQTTNAPANPWSGTWVELPGATPIVGTVAQATIQDLCAEDVIILTTDELTTVATVPSGDDYPLPQSRIKYKDAANASQRLAASNTELTGGLLEPATEIPRREMLVTGGGATGKYASVGDLVANTLPTIPQLVYATWAAGDGDTLGVVFPAAMQGVAFSFVSETVSNGTITVSVNNGSSFAAAPFTAGVAKVIFRRTTTTNESTATYTTA